MAEAKDNYCSSSFFRRLKSLSTTFYHPTPCNIRQLLEAAQKHGRAKPWKNVEKGDWARIGHCLGERGASVHIVWQVGGSCWAGRLRVLF